MLMHLIQIKTIQKYAQFLNMIHDFVTWHFAFSHHNVAVWSQLHLDCRIAINV